jgi:hypothetical protein
VHKLLARQLAKAAKGSGEFDLQALLTLVSEATSNPTMTATAPTARFR